MQVNVNGDSPATASFDGGGAMAASGGCGGGCHGDGRR